MDLLSTQGITSFINSYKQNEVNRRVIPVQTRKDKYSQLSTAFGDLKSKLTSLNDIISELKVTTSSSLFNSRSAKSSAENFITATASKNASVSSYAIRVNQLAKSDLIVSDTMTSDTSVTSMSGTHSVQIQSGNFTSNIDVELTASETNKSVMEALRDAINSDYAEIESTTKTDTDTFTGSGSFTISLGTDDDSTPTDYTIDYDYTGQTYDAILTDLVDNINGNTDGITAEKVVDGSNVSLKLTVDDKDQYISVQSSSDTGSLLTDLGIDVTKEKAASAISTASVFEPTTDNSKFSISADESGYDNRLIMSDVSGSIFNFIGLDSTTLTNRTVITGDDDAGFVYDSTSSTVNDLNAKLEFNGINIQRNSNTIDDLVDDVTFNVNALMDSEDSDVSVNVEINLDEIKGKIDDFISKFNDTYTYLKNRSQSDSVGRGIFVGDSTAQSLLSLLTNTVIGEVSGLSEDNYSYLSQIGISFDPLTGLSVSDSSALDDAIQNNPSQVSDLFNSDSGIAASLYSDLDGFLGVGGTISSITESFDNNITYLNDRIDSINSSIDSQGEILRQQFQDMQMQLAALISSQSFFSQTSGGFF